MLTREEKINKIFDRYVDSMRSRSLKWTIRGDSKWGDRRIDRYIKYFMLPFEAEKVIALLDTTVLRTGKEGLLFTYDGVIIKEVAAKLYYLEYEKIERAEVLEEVDEYYNVTTSVWVHFKDGTKKQIFDYYLRGNFFVDYINDIVDLLAGVEKPMMWEEE